MGIIVAIILGGLVGWLAGTILSRDSSVLGNIVIGIVGSFIGGFVSRMFTGSDQAFLAFSWMGLFWSLVGAVILVAILNSLSKSRHPA